FRAPHYPGPQWQKARQATTVKNITNPNYPIAAETLARFLRLQGLANVISKMQTLRLLGKRAFPSAYSRYIQWQYRRVSIAERVEAILCSQESPSHYDDEFNALQNSYTRWWGDYEYDRHSTWARGFERALKLMAVP